MKSLYVFLFVITSISINAQDSISSSELIKFNTNYKDFTIVENKVYAITKGDSLIMWNISNNKVEFIRQNINTITSKNNDVFATTINSKILYKDENKSWIIIDSIKGEAFKSFVDKNNQPVIITSRGFYKNGKMFSPNNCRIYHPKTRETLDEQFLNKPTFMYLDKKNRIWLTYDNGEFGNDCWFYDLNNNTLFKEEYLSIDTDYKRFDNRERYNSDLIKAFPDKIKIVDQDTLYKFPAKIPIYNGIKGIAQDASNAIYISQSISHFGVESSFYKIEETDFLDFYKTTSLMKIVEDISEVVTTDYGNGQKITETLTENEYFGALTFNKFNKHVNVFTSQGFFKITDDESGISKSLILSPNLTWKFGLEHSVGSQIAVKKFMFIDAIKFVFLTNVNGIGYFDGKHITYLK